MTRANQISGRAYLTNGRAIGGSAIPDSLVSLYEFEDDSDKTAALDSAGDNKASISGATYDPDSAVGSLALNFDEGDFVSNSAVDLSAQGDTGGIEISAWLKASETPSSTVYAFGWATGLNYGVWCRIDGSNGNITAITWDDTSGSTTTILDSGVALSTTTYQHVICIITG